MTGCQESTQQQNRANANLFVLMRNLTKAELQKYVCVVSYRATWLAFVYTNLVLRYFQSFYVKFVTATILYFKGEGKLCRNKED